MREMHCFDDCFDSDEARGRMRRRLGVCLLCSISFLLRLEIIRPTLALVFGPDSNLTATRGLYEIALAQLSLSDFELRISSSQR